MHEERQVLWIIQGNDDGLLEDGKPIYYSKELKGDGEGHQKNCQDFCRSYEIDNSFCTTHVDYAKLLTALGMIVVFNSDVKLDGKHFLGMYLPEYLSEKQIVFLEERRELFKEKYHHENSFFEARIYSSSTLSYKTTDGFRNLYIESIIEQKRTDDGQELLYREVERQKQVLMETSHENKI